MPENTTNAQQPDFAAMKHLNIDQYWWVKLPDGQLQGPFNSREIAEDTFARMHGSAAKLGMGERFGMGASILTTTRYFMETPAELDRDATTAARNKVGDAW